MQRTIKKELTFEGIGLHTGRYAKVLLKPASRDTGIVFIRTDKPALIKAHVGSVIDTAFATTIGYNGTKIRTVEHLMAAFAGLGIDNVYVEINGPEIPILDGSSTKIVDMILQAGIAKQGKQRPYLRILRTFAFEDRHSQIVVFPCETSMLTYNILFQHPGIGEQQLTIEINEENFIREIASARTFGFLKDLEFLRSNGLAKGGSLENAIVIGENGIINKTGLRFEDEFVRHKVLDLIGDFGLLGFPIKGHIVACKSGHSGNIRFLKKLISSPDVWQIEQEHTEYIENVLQINT